jgi:hypothetical protein
MLKTACSWRVELYEIGGGRRRMPCSIARSAASQSSALQVGMIRWYSGCRACLSRNETARFVWMGLRVWSAYAASFGEPRPTPVDG